MNYGYIYHMPTPDHYLLGTIGGRVLEEDGDWTPYLPKDEFQSRGNLETSNCTVYGTLNLIEILLARKTKWRNNFSERYLGTLAETSPFGNSPHYVMEVLRKFAGVVDDKKLPFSRDITTWEQYYAPVSFNLKLEGIKWLTHWDFKHEWVADTWATKPVGKDLLMDGLKFSPLGVAVQAWTKDNDFYVRNGADSHWCTLYGYKMNQYWKVFDHYDDTTKKLEWEYPFYQVKRVSLDPRTEPIDAKFIIRSFQGLAGLY